jgi:hypothetical protein
MWMKTEPNNLRYRLVRWLLAISGLLLISATGWEQTNPSLYGVPWNADGLSNLEVGKYEGRMLSYRFRAQHSGYTDEVRIYLIFRAPGYYKGDGGQVLLELQTDDGTPEHLPSGEVLASSLVTDPMKQWNRLFVFDQAVWLEEGQLYHMVFTNPASDPINNYVSVDGLWNRREMPDMQPGISDTDLAIVLKGMGSSSWRIAYSTTPIYALHYVDGFIQGQGYVDARSSSAIQNISGDNRVREIFTISGGDKTVVKVSARVRRSQGSENLKVRLEDSEGVLIEEGYISASSISTEFDWISYAFVSPHTLLEGGTYSIIFSAPSGSTYETFPLQDGTQYGFGCPSIFSDGHIQYTAGSVWQNVLNRTDFDLQFYFTLSSVPSCNGDLNLDERVDSLDLQQMVNILLGVETEPLCADLDGNSIVDEEDLQFLIRILLEPIVPLFGS